MANSSQVYRQGSKVTRKITSALSRLHRNSQMERWIFSIVAALVFGFGGEPAGMATARAAQETPPQQTQTPQNLDKVRDQIKDGKYQPYPFYGYPTWPDGGLRSSVADLARFLAAVMNGGELDGVRILNKSTVNEMLRSQIPANRLPPGQSGQGIFWAIVPIDKYGDFIGHTGGDPGVNTFLFFQPATGIGVLGLINGDGNGAAGEAIPQIGVRLIERGLERGF